MGKSSKKRVPRRHGADAGRRIAADSSGSPVREDDCRTAFKDLFSLVPIPIVMFRGHELILEVANEAALSVIGEDAVGKTLLDVLPETAADRCAEIMRQVMATGVPHIREEAFFGLDEHRPPFQGTSYWTFTCARWRHEIGGEPRALVVFSDVTAQVLAGRAMAAMAERAEAANQAKDQFFAVLSHELRNPLSPIVTGLELMRLRGLDTPEQALIERQVRHLVRLVDDLLDVSRIARGQIALKKRPMELSRIVATAVEMASPLFEARGDRLDVDVPAEGLTVDVDPDRMGQVISNLLTNAAKHSPGGSRIALTAAAAGDKIRLSVADEGIGIDEARLDTLFDPFVRHVDVPGRESGGLGLGLTIVWNLVRLHGGEVRAHSEGPGKGSEFVIELPRVEPERAAGGTAASPARRRDAPRPRKVLVVDDNPDAAETLGAALATVGHDVRIAHDAPSALSLAADFAPDTALIDIGLPIMDGYELASRLRERDGNVRLIAITGYGQAEDRRRSQAAGFDFHFTKPVALAELRSVLENE
jgi:signal transduction histidine kinase